MYCLAMPTASEVIPQKKAAKQFLLKLSLNVPYHCFKKYIK